MATENRIDKLENLARKDDTLTDEAKEKVMHNIKINVNNLLNQNCLSILTIIYTGGPSSI